MYEKLSRITNDQIQILRTLKETVPMTDKHIRLGQHGTDKISIYNYSKWSLWNRVQKNNFKSIFAQEDLDKSVVGWLLNLPSNTGFLDRMIAWEGQDNCGTVVAYALEDQEIYINDAVVTVLSGEGIKFKLNQPHEIKTSSNERNWACIMVMI